MSAPKFPMTTFEKMLNSQTHIVGGGLNCYFFMLKNTWQLGTFTKNNFPKSTECDLTTFLS